MPRRASSQRWFVYVVRCRDGSLYTGISNDVDARVACHNAGRGARYTRARRPVELVYTERKRSRSYALRREAAIKALPRTGKVLLIENGPKRPVARPRTATLPRVVEPAHARNDEGARDGDGDTRAACAP